MKITQNMNNNEFIRDKSKEKEGVIGPKGEK